MGYLFPFRTNPAAVNHKQIGIADFYEEVRGTDGTALGIIQDMCMPPPDVVRELGPPGFRWAAAVSADRLQTLICIAEDDPRPENRVSLSDDRTDSAGLPVTTVTHSYGEADLRRRDRLLAIARRVLRKAGGLVGKVRLIDSFSHAVGTVRFGRSPEESVLDPELPDVGPSQSVRRGWQLHADLRGREPEPHHHRQCPAGRCAHCRTVSESHRRWC